MNRRIINEIRDGTVIDHIEAGLAFRIYELLNLFDSDLSITIG
ncbi:MAG: aspartate carbamoyltransferase regulatory subunit, partial [Parachlamydiaceae bacterium]